VIVLDSCPISAASTVEALIEHEVERRVEKRLRELQDETARERKPAGAFPVLSAQKP
jgi:hypothetical protein